MQINSIQNTNTQTQNFGDITYPLVNKKGRVIIQDMFRMSAKDKKHLQRIMEKTGITPEKLFGLKSSQPSKAAATATSKLVLTV